MCNEKTAHNQFLNTRKLNNINGTVLARHLIQSFLPNEITPEKAHEIGKSLCKEILKDQYEYVLSTHIDKNHIHNHIIFNNVSFVTGKCYQSNKKTYHKIRSISDKLCKENNLSVVDEFYEKYKKKFKTKGKSYYEYSHYKKGTSWKSKLQFSIDKAVNKSNTWEEFLKIMERYGYEIKFGKHIAFKHKDKERFTRSKIIGEDYTEENLRKRIKESKIKELIDTSNKKIKSSKSYTHWARKENLKILSNTLLEMRNQNINSLYSLENTIKENIKKIKSSKSYTHWARKENLKILSNTLLEMRNQNINSLYSLENTIKENIKKLQDLQDKIKINEDKINHFSRVMECINIVNAHRKNNKVNENKYKNALNFLKQYYSKMPTTKEIFKELEDLEQKKNTLLKGYSQIKNSNHKLNKIKSNYKTFIYKNNER